VYNPLTTWAEEKNVERARKITKVNLIGFDIG
jgi:hypothetical protein